VNRAPTTPSSRGSRFGAPTTTSAPASRASPSLRSSRTTATTSTASTGPTTVRAWACTSSRTSRGRPGDRRDRDDRRPAAPGPAQLLGGTGDEVCLVGTSQGFDEHLPNNVAGADTAEQLPGALCGEDADATTLVRDALDAQDGEQCGQFSADVDLGKTTPTPAAVDSGVEGSLCVSGVWSVADRVRDLDAGTETEIQHALDTEPPNDIAREAGQVHQFSHWQSLETGTDTPGDRASC
jgi:hypothetical protein